jgi:hypothetical protein
VTGRLAQFGGRGSLSQSVADRIVRQFAERLRHELSGERTAADAPTVHEPAGEPPAAAEEALDAMALARGIAGEQLRRPAFVPALVALGVGILIGVIARGAAGRRR